MTSLIIVASLITAVLLINYLQNNHLDALPDKLKTWNFLPIYLRSLKPYDELIVSYLCFGNICKKIVETSSQEDKNIKFLKDKHDNVKVVVFTNNAYQSEL